MSPSWRRCRRTLAIISCTILSVCLAPVHARAFSAPALLSLRAGMHTLASHLPATSAMDVMDLSTGASVGYNANESMPAASTIKIPVMVEVFRQMVAGRFDLNREVTLESHDKDYGSGELCDEDVGSSHSVQELLSKMIDISDNTATNMLIRLVGRSEINRTMASLGLAHTRLSSDVRTDGWSVRQTLRSSPSDMVHLLSLMARRRLVDEWSSKEMIGILEADQINTLLPEPLPDDVLIAHKTGSFFDTLNDVGIVYEDDAPYVIAVMTTRLPSLPLGRSFIRTLSRLTFTDESKLAQWRSLAGIATLETGSAIEAPDVSFWTSNESINLGPGGDGG